MQVIHVKRYIHDALGMMFGWVEFKEDECIHHYGLISLDALQNQDCDALVTVSITDEVEGEAIYPRIRAEAQKLGMDLSEEEFEWCADKLESVRG